MTRIERTPPVKNLPPPSSDPAHLQNIILLTNQIVSSNPPGQIDPSVLANLQKEFNLLSPDLRTQLHWDLDALINCDPKSIPPTVPTKAGILNCDAAIAYCNMQSMPHSDIDRAKIILEDVDPAGQYSNVEKTLALVQYNIVVQVFNLTPDQSQNLRYDYETVELSKSPDQINTAFYNFQNDLNHYLPYPHSYT
jgi:hypothetical protein